MNPEALRSPYLKLDGAEEAPRQRSCDHAGCSEAGTYRAPKAPDRLDQHYWFCLDHVRAYNAAWDYLKGKSTADICDFQRATACWDRPTWKISGGAAKGSPRGARRIRIEDPLDILKGRFSIDPELEIERRRYDPAGLTPLKPEDRRALAKLGLDSRADKDDIKKAYKSLAKRYHPDVAGGDEASVARFRAITDAYRHLSAVWRVSSAGAGKAPL